MSHFDHLDLDGHLLGLLLAVAEEGSVTRAAQRLGLTQSAVSHALDKLRAIVGDALFVRSGRGIVPTARAEALVQQARLLLEQMRGFSTVGGFDAARFEGQITVAANDLQRDLLLPAWLQRLRAQAPGLRLRVVPSGVPRPEMLRDGGCQLVLSPRPPEAADLVQNRLFDDRYAVFYDAARRPAPASLADYLAAEHVTVVYEPRRALDLDQWLAEQGVVRQVVATVPGFAGLPAFVRGSRLLCTAPSRLGLGLLGGLASVLPPLPCPTLPMYAIWHVRHQADALHQWLRGTLDEVAATVAFEAG
ncbi:LysR family transcriptional regulator [Aquabacterium sp. OR-4]|nr:LysR family transcriptional regulator [Aquabacterium sp. OR-4]MDT7834650.1 LysR family transcriptional regulator [Aquabacterium sp. OR-4]